MVKSMSDPVTNVEIEDVLSSIRRLVSNEESEPDKDEQQEEAAPDRLVLTDALRVDAPTRPDDDVPDAADAQSVDWPDEERAPDSEYGEDEPDDEPSHDSPPDTDDRAESMDSAPSEDSRAEDALKARVAKMEAAVDGRDEEWEPDGTTDDAYSGGAGEPLPWEDYTVGSDEAISEPEEETPDFGPADSGEIWDAADVSEAEQMANPAPTTAARDDLDLGDDRSSEDEFAVADDILDEDALRELVADIVREELQGALGERITRNVRKLVRREIHRALAVQDLD